MWVGGENLSVQSPIPFCDSSFQGKSSPGSILRVGAMSECPTIFIGFILWRRMMSLDRILRVAIALSLKGIALPSLSLPLEEISIPIEALLTSVIPRQKDSPACQALFSSSTSLYSVPSLPIR